MEIKEHRYFANVDWDIVSACKIPSPLKGVKGVPKRKKDKETQAQRTAHSMLEGEMKEVAQEEVVHTWDYVSPVAITEEYLESMYRCVSSIWARDSEGAPPRESGRDRCGDCTSARERTRARE